MASHHQQQALRDDVSWLHQPAFIEEFHRLTNGDVLTDIEIELVDEGRREPRWNFTADDLSFT